jgi:hypothetical protein
MGQRPLSRHAAANSFVPCLLWLASFAVPTSITRGSGRAIASSSDQQREAICTSPVVTSTPPAHRRARARTDTDWASAADGDPGPAGRDPSVRARAVVVVAAAARDVSAYVHGDPIDARRRRRR